MLKHVITIFGLAAIVWADKSGTTVENINSKTTTKRQNGCVTDMVNVLSDIKAEWKIQRKQCDDMERLVKELSNKTLKLEGELAAIKKNTAPQANVAFYAWLANENTARSRVIKYDRVVTNIGNGYSVSTGRFVAPVSGTYLFSVTVSGKGGVGPAHLDIMKNNMEVGVTRSERTGDMDLGTQVVILSLKASDKVYIKNFVNHGLHTHKGRYAFNTFSGFMIRQYV